jgi:endonuclease/exonuclease/phosphatase family metal-dependent hydrolase
MNMWQEKVSLKFALLNAENLFLLFDRPPTAELTKTTEAEWQRLSTSIFPNKPLDKVKELARTLNDINADVVMLCEVGGPESLANFNNLFLNQQYSPIVIEGNSDRNIDVGFLIKKNQSYYFDLASNKNRPINYLYPHERDPSQAGIKITSHKFSRDAVELRLFKKERDNPFLVIILTHLKSPLDKDRIDPMGFERRRAELITLTEIYREVTDLHKNCPVVVAGDFNGNASRQSTDPEFKFLYESTELEDVLELAGKVTHERATYYQVRTSGKVDGKQIDYCFLSPLAAKCLKPGSAMVYRYKDEYGFEIDIPKSLDAKLNLPSDHYPVVFELENIEVF